MINKICSNIDKNHIYNCTSKTIGRQGENICTQLEITLEECLCDSWVYLHFEKADGKTKVTERLEIIDNKVIYDIGNDLLDVDGDLKVFVELHKESGLVWRSSTKTYTVLNSFNGVDQIENKEDFISNAQKTLDNVETLKEEVETGLTPTIGENENWFICGVDTGKTSRGIQGEKGDTYTITEDDYSAIAGKVEGDLEPRLNDIEVTHMGLYERVDEALRLAKGANKAISFLTYNDMINTFNSLGTSDFNVGQIVNIATLNVPDLWVFAVVGFNQEYKYTNDEAFVNALKTQTMVQVGNYIFCALETLKVDLTDYAKRDEVPKVSYTYGIYKTSGGVLYIDKATQTAIDNKTDNYHAIVPSNLDYAVKSVVGGHVTLTQAEYDALETIDENTFYYIKEEE